MCGDFFDLQHSFPPKANKINYFQESRHSLTISVTIVYASREHNDSLILFFDRLVQEYAFINKIGFARGFVRVYSNFLQIMPVPWIFPRLKIRIFINPGKKLRS